MVRTVQEMQQLILKVLAVLPRSDSQILGDDLLIFLRKETGDATIQEYEIKDAFELLKNSGYVQAYTAMNERSRKYGFHSIKITGLGRDKLQRKESEDYTPASNIAHYGIHIEGYVNGPVIQSRDGDIYNYQVSLSSRISSFQELIEKVLSDNMLSDYGKDTIIEQIKIIESETSKTEPDTNKIKLAWEWLKRNGPRFIEGVLVRLIPGIIMQKIQ